MKLMTQSKVLPTFLALKAIRIICVFLFLISSISGQNKSQSVKYSILFNPSLSMVYGTESIAAIHSGWSKFEDNLIGTKWFEESGITKAAGISARMAKLVILDTPIDYFSIVLMHEFWGHGSRYREFDINGIFYKFDLPPPYGWGGGKASNTKNIRISLQQINAIWMGGIESHPLLNRNLGLRWMLKDEIHYREAAQYFWAFQIMITYISESSEVFAPGQHDNDPQAYIRLLNTTAGIAEPEKFKYGLRDLKRAININAVNPFIFYSIYSLLKTYLWDGDRSLSNFPKITIGEIDYLPALRAGLTPFGIEYHLENYLYTSGTAAMLDLSLGEQTFAKSWGAVGVSALNFIQNERLDIDISARVWRQPSLAFGAGSIPSLTEKRIGAGFSVRANYLFSGIEIPLAGVLELGYKSSGFWEGYPLDSSLIFALGFALEY